LTGFAGQEAAPGVEEEAVGVGVLAEDVRLALAVEPADVAVAAGEHAELRVPRRALAAGALARLDPEQGAGVEDRFFGGGRRGEGQGAERDADEVAHRITSSRRLRPTTDPVGGAGLAES